MNMSIDKPKNLSDQPTTASDPWVTDRLLQCLLHQLQPTAEDLAAVERQGAVQINQRGQRGLGKYRFCRMGKRDVRGINGADAAGPVPEGRTYWQASDRDARERLNLARPPVLRSGAGKRPAPRRKNRSAIDCRGWPSEAGTGRGKARKRGFRSGLRGNAAAFNTRVLMRIFDVVPRFRKETK